MAGGRSGYWAPTDARREPGRRPGEEPAGVFDVDLERLAAAVPKLDGDLEEFAIRLLEELRPTTVDDDVALVVVRRG